MSIGALSYNAATSALLASPLPALESRAGDARMGAIDPAAPSSRTGRHDRTFQRYKAADTPERESRNQGTRQSDDAAPTHPSVLSPQKSEASASTLFVTQVLGQDARQTPGPGLPAIDHAMDGHRDGPELGSLHYRMAGAEPLALGAAPALLSISV